MRRRLGFAIVVLIVPLLLGHGDEDSGCCHEDDSHGVELGPPTGALCPSTQTLTYDNFAGPFMEKYCTRCHSSKLSGEDRNGAPLYHDFDTLAGIRPVANHVDQMAGSGPNATNLQMPPDGDMPTLEERQKLAEWIACGIP